LIVCLKSMRVSSVFVFDLVTLLTSNLSVEIYLIGLQLIALTLLL